MKDYLLSFHFVLVNIGLYLPTFSNSTIPLKVLLRENLLGTLYISLSFFSSTLISFSSFQLAQKPLSCGQVGKYIANFHRKSIWSCREEKNQTKTIQKSK